MACSANQRHADDAALSLVVPRRQSGSCGARARSSSGPAVSISRRWGQSPGSTGHSAIETGLIFTAATAGILISSLAAERLAKRRAQSTLIRAGFLITLI